MASIAVDLISVNGKSFDGSQFRNAIDCFLKAAVEQHHVGDSYLGITFSKADAGGATLELTADGHFIARGSCLAPRDEAPCPEDRRKFYIAHGSVPEKVFWALNLLSGRGACNMVVIDFSCSSDAPVPGTISRLLLWRTRKGLRIAGTPRR